MSAGNALFYPAAIWIDNIQLTDQGRAPVTQRRDERSTINELASGRRKKYIKGVKRIFAMSWSYLPDLDTCNIDGYAGRLTMINNFAYDGDLHLLRFYHRNGEYSEHSVFVTSYEETLIRRDPVSGVFIWDVTLEFEES